MNRAIREKALAAAARVTFSVGMMSLAAGCGAASDSGDGETGNTNTSSASADLKKQKNNKTDHCHDDGSAVDTSDPQACEALVQTTYPKESVLSQDDVKNASADVKACCDTLATEWDKNNTWGAPERTTCCSILGWQGHPTCTPWGPPVPPAFKSKKSRGTRRMRSVRALEVMS
jgi:hypothetical protein